MDLTLNIYDKSGKEVVKVLKSSTYDLFLSIILDTFYSRRM